MLNPPVHSLAKYVPECYNEGITEKGSDIMREHFPDMLDCPDTPKIIVSVLYCILAFFSLPFIMLLLMQGSFNDEAVLSGVQIAYHVINFLAAVWIYREYLGDALLNVQIDVKGFLKTVGTCVTVMVMLAWAMFRILSFIGGEQVYVAAFGILPLSEVELFALSSDLVLMNPIFGTICLVVLVPVSVSCLFYSMSFAPVCCKRPWLAYIVVALVIAFPRVCNGMTYWDPTQQAILYFTQLPMHLLACWAYQKMDTVWAPIAVLAVVNLLSSGMILLAYG